MILEADKKSIISIAEKYHASKVLLFGSSIKPGMEGSDIDLAVEGIKPSEFFQFYGELLFALSKPVDMIDLTRKSKFTQLISKEGVLIYG